MPSAAVRRLSPLQWAGVGLGGCAVLLALLGLLAPASAFFFPLLSLWACLVLFVLAVCVLRTAGVELGFFHWAVVFGIWAVAVVYFYWTLSSRSFVYVWDYANYLLKQYDAEAAFAQSTGAGFRFLLDSITEDYTNFITLFTEFPFCLSGKTGDDYAFCQVFSVLPSLLVLLAALRVKVGRMLRVKNRFWYFLIGFSWCATFPFVRMSAVLGQPDWFGLIFAFMLMLLTLDYRFDVIDLPRYLLIFAATSDFLIAQGIYRVRSRAAKRWLVVLSVMVNLGMLGYFKYTNFLVDIANQMFGQGFLQFQNIFLPVGISFFVFQSMSYTIDIYRGQLKPLGNWCDYLFYLSFFPQLVAGPIVRARDFIPQIRRNPVVVTREMFGTGVFLILTGLFKKAIISDYISLNFVDRIFDEPLLYSGFECLAGIYGYALQIYCDFSGYSDMAIGIALLLGFRFPKNFDAPYKSATITEFWRRWHISLSSWLRDYLYISLGGNRKGKLRTYGNLLVTMVLGGLWHGAAIRFILWGTLHGVALALHKLWMAVVPGAKATGAQMHWWSRAAGVFFTFNLVCLGWLMFRAESMQTVELMLHQIFSNFNVPMIPQVIAGYAGVFALIGAGYLLHLMPGCVDRAAQRLVANAPLVLQVVMAAAMIWCVMQIKSSDIQPFIYFQF